MSVVFNELRCFYFVDISFFASTFVLNVWFTALSNNRKAAWELEMCMKNKRDVIYMREENTFHIHKHETHFVIFRPLTRVLPGMIMTVLRIWGSSYLGCGRCNQFAQLEIIRIVLNVEILDVSCSVSVPSICRVARRRSGGQTRLSNKRHYSVRWRTSHATGTCVTSDARRHAENPRISSSQCAFPAYTGSS